MDSIRIRQGSLRAMIAVCVLAGVLAMHGLTGNHDAAMPLVNHDATMPLVDQDAAMALVDQAPAVAAADHGAEVAGQAVPSVDAVPRQSLPALTAQVGHDRHVHTMGDVCLAMLATLLLALVAALALRSLIVAYPVALAGPTVRVAVDGPSRPWQQPTLSKLCVLRT